MAFLAEDTNLAERTDRQYVAHLQRITTWLESHFRAGSWGEEGRNNPALTPFLRSVCAPPSLTPRYIQVALHGQGNCLTA